MRNDLDRIRDALRFIPVGGHDERVRVAFMLKSELGEAGRDLWNEWRDSRGDDEAASVWKSASETGPLKIGTLFHEAKASGWRDDGIYRVATREEVAERKRIVEARTAREEAEIARERADTVAKATAILKASTEAKADHPYLTRKGVSPVSTLREIEAGAAATILGYAPKSDGDLLTGRLLVVPVKQVNGISTLELIDGDKRKAALTGRGSKAGGYWATERLPDGNGNGLTLLIGEGVATVLSTSAATAYPGIAALSSGNLPAVAKAMRECYPAAMLVILADLVKITGEPDRHAIEAARSVGGKLAIPDFGSDRDRAMTDFNDMAVAFGAEAVASIIANANEPASVKHQPSSDSDGWQESQPLAVKVEPELYPFDALPDTIRLAVEEVQAFTKAPIALVASSALAALSLAIQAHADTKRAERLTGPVGLFLLTIADSGERKSTCDGFFTAAIREYEARQGEAAKPDIRNHKADLDAWSARRAGLIEKIRQNSKADKPTGELEANLRRLEHDKPEPPRVPKLLRGDETPENLAWVLAREWPSGGVLSSEAGVVFGAHGMGKDSIMRNLALLNILWDGGTLSIGRRTSESFTVRGARLTVALQVQEMTLRSFFDRSGGLARGTGFLARFMVAWPESTQGFRLFTEPPASWPALAAFNRRIAAILDQSTPIDNEGVLSPPLLSLSPDAKVAWIAFHDAIERELANGGELYDVRDVASKSADNAARLAALFQMFEQGIGAISLEAFEGASRIAAWHLNEARRFFGELALPAELANAARLDRWLIEYCRRERTRIVPRREVQRCGPNGLRDKVALEGALQELVEAGRVRVVRDGRNRNVEVNPILIEGDTI